MTEEYTKNRTGSSYRRYNSDESRGSYQNRNTDTSGLGFAHTNFANAIKCIAKYVPSDFKPKTAFILGSGLGDFIDSVYVVAKISYKKLPGFFSGRVPGQAKDLVFGYLGDKPVVIMSGRVHLYEGATHKDISFPIRLLKLLGCEHLILSNAAGSLTNKFQPGEVALIEDHINLQWVNPLIGENAEFFGPRFVPMDDAYDFMLREAMTKLSKSLDITLHSGVYAGVLGPTFETPAEVKAIKMLGADLVGMSTVGEVIAARHCGLKVLALSAVTNMATGLTEVPVNHDTVLDFAKQASDKLFQLMTMALDIEL